MYCMSCGTHLPDDARFCFKCGATQVKHTESNETLPSDILALPDDQQQQMVRAIADWATKPITDTVEHLSSVARYGPVTHTDVLEALDVIKYFEDRGTPFPENHIMKNYFYAAWIEKYFLNAWDTEGKERIKNDWNIYITKGFSEFLKLFIRVNWSDRTKKVEQLLKVAGGLVNWLEFDLLGHIFILFDENEIKLSGKEERLIADLYNEKRFQEIVNANNLKNK